MTSPLDPATLIS